MKKPSPETIVLVKEWIFYAEEDFRNAEHTLTMTENCPFSTVCFHAQQVVEKYIKAFLTLRAIPFARTHDIENLIHQLPEDIQIPLSIEEQRLLTDYATVSRYPGEWEPIDRCDAKSAVALAKKVREMIRPHFPPETLES